MEQKVSRLYDFTASLVDVFEMRRDLLGKVDCQKSVYFMKRLGADVPFNFRWNMFGPYSYDLAHYCKYLEIEGLIEYSGTYSLNKEKAKTYVSALKPETEQKLKVFFAEVKEICEMKNYDKVLFLECAASLDFIRMNVLRKSVDKRLVFGLLEKLKPHRVDAFRLMREDAWCLIEGERLV